VSQSVATRTTFDPEKLVRSAIHHLPLYTREEAPAEKPAREIRLDWNESPYGPSPKALAALAAVATHNRYPEFDGLNLTWESLEGIVKHNGPLAEPGGRAIGRYRGHGVPAGIADYVGIYDLELWSFASLEAQVAAIADDIAYDAHDIDDGLRAGLFTVDDLKVMPLAAEMIADIAKYYPALDDIRRGAELVRELISYLIGAVVSEARRRLEVAQPKSVDDVRNHGEVLIAFSAGVAQAEADIKAFLKQRMYRHPRVMRVMGEAEQILFDLFARYQSSPSDLPAEWLPDDAGHETEAERARRIGNFIAGMTDRFALTEHQRLFDSTPDLR